VTQVVIGLDVGTGSTKGVAVSAGGRVLAQARAAHPTALGPGGEAEQDPADWLAGCARVASALLATGAFAPRDVEAVALSGQIRTLVLADAAGAAVGPALLWYDPRWDAGAEAVRRSLRSAPAIRLGPRSVVSKLLWVRREQPERHAATAWVLSPKDFVKWHLCGRPVTDCSDASGTGLLDVARRRWAHGLIDALGVDPATLPPLIESTAVAGPLTAEGARLLGLPAGTPVVQGGSDNACGALGAGVIDGDEALVGLGTSGVVLAGLPAPRPTEPPVELWCHAAPDRWYAWEILLTGGRALDWAFTSLFSLPLASPDGQALLREALELPPAPGRPIFLPYLGDQHDGAGGFAGLRVAHARADVARAVLDGIALALGQMLDRIRAAGIAVARAVAVGPLAREPAWRAVLAAALRVPVVKPDVEDAAELGAAVLAAAGCGLAASVPQAVRSVVSAGPETIPAAPALDVYADLAQRFAAALAS
jgi:xylulokinase